jgi:hypothetical protein
VSLGYGLTSWYRIRQRLPRSDERPDDAGKELETEARGWRRRDRCRPDANWAGIVSFVDLGGNCRDW